MMSELLADGAELSLIASCPRGLADLLVQELIAFGATEIRERTTGVTFRGTLECAYRVCLGSRTANRLFLEIAHFSAATTEEVYAEVRRIDWTRHLGPQATVSIDLPGASLRRGGCPGEGGEAPLKENVAAGSLLRAGWPQRAAAGAG